MNSLRDKSLFDLFSSVAKQIIIHEKDLQRIMEVLACQLSKIRSLLLV